MTPRTHRLLSYMAARAAEPSSWRGLVNVLAAAGLSLAPAAQDLVVSAGLGVVQAAFGISGLIALLTPDVTHPRD